MAAGAGGGALLGDLVQAELAPFGARAQMSGPSLVTGSSFAQMFALIIHELATNAAKHGALASAGGRVAISWAVETDAGERALHFAWRERGGGPVVPPTHRGFGTELIGMLGRPRLVFAAEGFEYEMTVPLAEVAR